MEIINFIFRLGVLFVTFGFIWGLINFGIQLLRAGQPRAQAEVYIIKFVRYFFLVNVTFLFCIQEDGNLSLNKSITAGLILLVYFLSKFQKNQIRNKFMQMQMQGAGMMKQMMNPNFNAKAEAIVISVCVVIFGAFFFFPAYANNPISNWFYDSIISIENTFFFGFIFKVIGFFFMFTLIMKMVNSFSNIGNPPQDIPSQKEERKDDDFDDYEEIK